MITELGASCAHTGAPASPPFSPCQGGAVREGVLPPRGKRGRKRAGGCSRGSARMPHPPWRQRDPYGPPPPPQARLHRCGRGALGHRWGLVTRAPPAPNACQSSILTLMGHGFCRARRSRPAAMCRTAIGLGLREGRLGRGGRGRRTTSSSPESGQGPSSLLWPGPGRPHFQLVPTTQPS